MKGKIPTAGWLSLSVLVAVMVSSCSTIDMPEGASKGYASARFIRVDPAPAWHVAERSEKVNRMIQSAIAAQFENHGLDVRETDADLIIGYLLIIQDNVSTAMIDDHFGYGRGSDKIMDRAHTQGVIKGRRSEDFDAGAIVIDVIDAASNKLVYRNYAQRDLVKNISDDARQERIDDAVREALNSFFR